MSSEVEQTLARIQSHKGVKGVLIVNKEGKPFEWGREGCKHYWRFSREYRR